MSLRRIFTVVIMVTTETFSLPLLSVPRWQQYAGQPQLLFEQSSWLGTQLHPGFGHGWAQAAGTHFSRCSFRVKPVRPAGPICSRSAATASGSVTREALLTHQCQRTGSVTPCAPERTPWRTPGLISDKRCFFYSFHKGENSNIWERYELNWIINISLNFCYLLSPVVCLAVHTCPCIPQHLAGPVWFYPAGPQVSVPPLAERHGLPASHPH